MKKYDVKTVGGVDFIYIGNDVNGNCKYAVNYRAFLKEEEMNEEFAVRFELARKRAKKAFFDRVSGHLEPFFVIRPLGNFATVVRHIQNSKA